MTVFYFMYLKKVTTYQKIPKTLNCVLSPAEPTQHLVPKNDYFYCVAGDSTYTYICDTRYCDTQNSLVLQVM